MSLREQMAQGQAARELLEHPAFQSACARLETDTVREWRESAPEDTELRQQAYYKLQALDALRRELRIALDNGQMAASALDKREA